MEIQTVDFNVWPKGDPNTAYAQYFIGNSYLADVICNRIILRGVSSIRRRRCGHGDLDGLGRRSVVAGNAFVLLRQCLPHQRWQCPFSLP